MGKNKGDQPDAKWRHSAEAVEKGKVSYNCKYWGSTPVSQSKGSELIKEAIKKLQFANDIKKSEAGLKASKLKKVEFCVSTQNLILTETKSKTTLYSFPLQRVSYCADDKTSKKLFGFIARDKESSQHHCYILECEKNAEELTLAVGQAFELAYKRYKANQEGAAKDVNEMKQRVESTEKENELLRKRLEELEKNQQQSVSSPPPLATVATSANQSSGTESIAQVPSQQTFDPFAESPAPTFQSSSFDVQSPSPFPTDPRPLPPGVGTNPFATHAGPAPVSNNEGDLLDIFGGQTKISSASAPEDDIFDPLVQMNDTTTQEPAPQQPNFSSFDQASSQPEAPRQQNEMLVSSVSRPKPATLGGGLLPPPPTKQTIKERNRNSNTTANHTNGVGPALSGLNTQADQSQGVQEVQNGMQNNLVLF